MSVDNEMTALIDGDLLFYAIIAAAEYGNDPADVDLEKVYHSMEVRASNVMLDAGCIRKRIFITKGNFRHFIIGNYKANRKDSWRPSLLPEVMAYAEVFMGAEFQQGLEADDLIGINMTENTVCCTIDKDLQQLDGEHHRWAYLKKPYENFSVEDGYRKFYEQLLMGDPTDGIIGCGVRKMHVYKSGLKCGEEYMKRTGVGEKTAIKLLSDAKTEQEMFDICLGQYQKYYSKDHLKNLVQQARLVYMVREVQGDFARMWMPPNSKEKVYINTVTGEFGLDG